VGEYRGCAIRGASYRSPAGDWVPEAYWWQYTEAGPVRLWAKSFEHLFAAERPTFETREPADRHAFQLAKAVIDRLAGWAEGPDRAAKAR
jgi:hypothetical protein